MKLSQFQRSRSGKNVSYRTPLPSNDGGSQFELTVEGRQAGIEKMLGDIDMKVEVSSAATIDDMNKRVSNLLRVFYTETYRRAMDPKILTPPRAGKNVKDPSGTVTLSIRPTAEHGTAFYFDSIVPIVLPTAILLQVVFPPCSVGGAASFPVSGNPNVRLRFNNPGPPNVALSTFPGLSVDLVSFALPPWTLVIPFYQFPVAVAPATARIVCWGANLLPF